MCNPVLLWASQRRTHWSLLYSQAVWLSPPGACPLGSFPPGLVVWTVNEECVWGTVQGEGDGGAGWGKRGQMEEEAAPHTRVSLEVL